jgi:hypothetical protein
MTDKKKRTPKELSRQIEQALNELADANTQLAKKQYDQLLKTYFEPASGSGAPGNSVVYSYTPKMVTIEMARPVVTIDEDSGETNTEMVPIQVEIPLLTLMPVSLLGVEDVDISINVTNEQHERLLSVGEEREEHEDDFTIELHCEQQPLPMGLAKLMNILTENIEPVQM